MSEKCRANESKIIPFVLLRQYGLIGSLRIDIDENCVAEQKPYQVELQDLRLNNPFEELVAYCKEFDLPSLPLEEHSHIPYVVPLLQAADKWRESHNGEMPKSFKEKGEFKEFLKTLALDYSKEINFSEAIKQCYLLFQDKELPYNL